MKSGNVEDTETHTKTDRIWNKMPPLRTGCVNSPSSRQKYAKAWII
jgi:hypothetical protein